jgi:hypothetical protein
MTGQSTVRLTLAVLAGVVGGAFWLWAILGVVYHEGPVALPLILGLVLVVVAVVLAWKGTAQPEGG